MIREKCETGPAHPCLKKILLYAGEREVVQPQSNMMLPACRECTACPCPQLAALEGSPSTEVWPNRAGNWDGEPGNMHSDTDSAA